MRYIMTIFWSFLIAAAVSYVLSSMGGEPFLIQNAVILTAIFSIVVFVLGDGILKEKTE
ncbi:YjzD family protein [Oceanobacillus sp. 1P07AA]|uniref:YjzD family protein n=1 Tax=Oceanobacillus sp. 1P07AA TaxID=3132293 RepID=UPI0039A77EB6